MRNYPAAASGSSLLEIAGNNSNWFWRRLWIFFYL